MRGAELMGRPGLLGTPANGPTREDLLPQSDDVGDQVG